MTEPPIIPFPASPYCRVRARVASIWADGPDDGTHPDWRPAAGEKVTLTPSIGSQLLTYDVGGTDPIIVTVERVDCEVDADGWLVKSDGRPVYIAPTDDPLLSAMGWTWTASIKSKSVVFAAPTGGVVDLALFVAVPITDSTKAWVEHIPELVDVVSSAGTTAVDAAAVAVAARDTATTARTEAVAARDDAAAYAAGANVLVGGRNLLLNSATFNAVNSNNSTAWPMSKGADEIGNWITGTHASTDLFFLSTYAGRTYINALGDQFSSDIMPLPDVFTQSVEFMSDTPIAVRAGEDGDPVVLEPGKWTRISRTFTPSDTSGSRSRMWGPVVPATEDVPVGTKLYHRNWKLEFGSHATDWTPAPEDIGVNPDTAQWAAPHSLALELAGQTIVGTGRPDIPATLTTPGTAALVAAATSGTVFRSTDGPQGAWEWKKRGTAWVVTSASTGIRDISDLLINEWSGTLYWERVNNTCRMWSRGTLTRPSSSPSDHFADLSSTSVRPSVPRSPSGVAINSTTRASHVVFFVQSSANSFTSYVGGGLPGAYSLTTYEYVPGQSYPVTLPGTAI